jgi:RNA polymerase sigma factor for flagellar operon FliA
VGFTVGNAPKPADSPEVVARVHEGLELVNIVARQMRRQFGDHVHLDDLASQGREALLAAARSYDPERGVPFQRWANLRIRGAMIDYARQSGTLPKRVYRKLRALQAAEHLSAARAEQPLATAPTTPDQADQAVGDELASAAMAMALGFLSMRHNEALEHAKDPDHSPESNVSYAELVARVKAAVAELPLQERTLLQRHYFEDVNLDEASRELGLSKSWGSRLHARGVEALAKVLRPSTREP